ncbi:MAG: FtsX-like permease family protein [Acidobacteria bacterium]|nr:MAG: FtsX-like permease family protein [Acidobacteriota bacterium]
MILVTLRQAVRDLSSQRLRTALTTFGIVWGTVSICLLLAFGEGLHGQIYRNSAGLGENIVIVWPARTSRAWQGVGRGRPIRVRPGDLDAVRREARSVRTLSAEMSRDMRLVAAGRTLSVPTHGVEPAFGALRNLIPERGGRFLDPLDERRRRRVAFLGDELARELFGSSDPVGEAIRLDGSPFLVVGVLRAKEQDSSYSGRDEAKAFIPLSTFSAVTGQRLVDNFVLKAADSGATPAAKNEVRRLLARRLRFDPADDQALAMWDTTEMFQFLDGFMVAFRTFLGIVGSLTLLVGGIGVSNIMNVVVEERTREIGIKMALGATPGAVLRQMMLETVLITLVGGALGLAIATTICAAFPSLGLTEYVGDPVVSPGVAGATAALLGAVALVAGWFPARAAARLDPVVAMKTE